MGFWRVVLAHILEGDRVIPLRQVGRGTACHPGLSVVHAPGGSGGNGIGRHDGDLQGAGRIRNEGLTEPDFDVADGVQLLAIPQIVEFQMPRTESAGDPIGCAGLSTDGENITGERHAVCRRFGLAAQPTREQRLVGVGGEDQRETVRGAAERRSVRRVEPSGRSVSRHGNAVGPVERDSVDGTASRQRFHPHLLQGGTGVADLVENADARAASRNQLTAGIKRQRGNRAGERKRVFLRAVSRGDFLERG